jgi:hypothetical protein
LPLDGTAILECHGWRVPRVCLATVRVFLDHSVQ